MCKQYFSECAFLLIISSAIVTRGSGNEVETYDKAPIQDKVSLPGPNSRMKSKYVCMTCLQNFVVTFIYSDEREIFAVALFN